MPVYGSKAAPSGQSTNLSDSSPVNERLLRLERLLSEQSHQTLEVERKLQDEIRAQTLRAEAAETLNIRMDQEVQVRLLI